MSYINKNIIVLPLIYDSQSEIETICLKQMKNATERYWLQACEITENLKKPQNSSNFFYFSGRYVRKAKFSNGEDQLCALGLSAAIKNHKDTF